MYTIVYREGGTHRCRWTRLPRDFDDMGEAQDYAWRVELMGYKTLVHETKNLDVIGLPIGWDTSTPCEGWILQDDGFHWLKAGV